MKVRDPAGGSWRVKRRWLPWRRRFNGGWDVPSFDVGDDPVSLVIGTLILVPALILFLLWGFELLLVLLLLPFAILARTRFGKHWYVEIWHQRTFVRQFDGGDFEASGALVRRLAAEIESGHPPSSDPQPVPPA